MTHTNKMNGKSGLEKRRAERESGYYEVSADLDFIESVLGRSLETRPSTYFNYAVDSDNFHIYLSCEFHEFINARHGGHLNFGGRVKITNWIVDLGEEQKLINTKSRR